MRGKNAIKNTLIAFIQELVAIICGFILPKVILRAYGSQYNGLTTSITQFLGCAVLFRAGIGGATRSALYKPLAQNDKDKINSIMSATDQYMKKIAIILGICIIFFSCIYPLMVLDEFSWFFSFSLFLIIGISTFMESLLGITYLILLQADQKLYVTSIAHIIVYLLNTLLAVILVKFGASIHIVKFGSAFAFTLYPLILNIYVKKKYKLNLKVEPDNTSIGQRWDAFFHQVANFVMINTDTLVLTFFSNMLEVSVYSIYNLVINGLRKFVSNFTNGLEAAFGNMIANNEKDNLRRNFYLIEWLIYSIATIVYSVTVILILQFVSIYTNGINDVNYIRPTFSYILIIAQFFNCIRQPYQLVVQAAGHYKQTKKGAMIEPIINIVLSIILVIKLGIVGVAIGTLCATIFRTFQYSYYVSRNIIKGSFKSMLSKCLLSFIESILIIFVYYMFKFDMAQNYFDLIINFLITICISLFVVGFFSIIFYINDFKMIMRKLKNMIFMKKLKINDYCFKKEKNE